MILLVLIVDGSSDSTGTGNDSGLVVVIVLVMIVDGSSDSTGIDSGW